MAYYFYDGIKNANGFIGFRAARSFPQKGYRQKYFPLSQYSYEEAKKLAKELSDEWNEEAKQLREKEKEDRLTYIFSPKRQEKESVIIAGMFCSLEYRKPHGRGRTFEFSPSFCITLDNGRKVFRITKHGYDTAFSLAVDFYANKYKMYDSEKEQLLSRKPCPSVFTGALRNRLLKLYPERNIPTVDEIDDAINLIEPQPAYRIKTGGAEKRIADGFSAAVVNGANWFYAPAFVVKKGSEEQTIYIRAGKREYDKAFKKAFELYSEMYRLSASDERVIQNRKPSKETFISEVLKAGYERHGFSKQQYESLRDTIIAS